MEAFFLPGDPAKAQMQAEAGLHDIKEFIEELSSDRLVTLLNVIDLCAGSDRNAGFVIGVIAGVRSQKEKVCLVCGKDHDKDLTEGLEKISSTESPAHFNKAEFAAKLLEYRLVENDQGMLSCSGCGMQYVSLADRMLKTPDDCPGCHNKSRWG